MEKLEDNLPGIENFLRNTLAKESLSKLAENQRLYYVERLDIIQLPPHLPPKPDGGEKTQMQGRKLPEPGKSKSDEDFIAHQRAISRQARIALETLSSATCEDNPVPNNGLGIDSDQYDDGLYEEPVPMESNSLPTCNQPPMATAAKFDVFSDGDSSTSYESYDEPDGDEPYNNVGYDGQIKPDIPLPRLKTKRKKKPASINDRYYKKLHAVIHEGELYHRGKIAFTSAWTKRFCAICDGIFYCYKDRDSKPIFSVPLFGYDVILQEKEKGRSNVLRLSHPGCETHFLSTDSASETQAWMNKIEALCYAPCTDVQEDSKSTDRTGSVSSMELYTESPGSAMANGSPSMKNRKVTNTLSSDGKREKKGKIGKFLSETFGKRKGRLAAQHLEISEGALLDRNSISSPDIIVAGVVKLSSPALLGEDTWQYKNCAIRNGVFECYKDDSTSSDLDFALLLADYELSSPNKNLLSLAVTRQGETAFVMEPENKIDQGDWLSALLKYVGNGGMPGTECDSLNDLTYTYVDSRSIGSLPSDSFEVNSLALSLNDQSENDRQYADLSDKQSESGSSEGGGDTYDEPPAEVADRESKMYLQGNTDSLTRLFAGGSYSNVYEEVAETCSPSSSLAPSNRSSTASGFIAQIDAAVESAAASSDATSDQNCLPNELSLADWLMNADDLAEQHTYAVIRGGNNADTGDIRRFSNSSEYDLGALEEQLSSNLTHAVSLEELLAADPEVYCETVEYDCASDVEVVVNSPVVTGHGMKAARVMDAAVVYYAQLSTPNRGADNNVVKTAATLFDGQLDPTYAVVGETSALRVASFCPESHRVSSPPPVPPRLVDPPIDHKTVAKTDDGYEAVLPEHEPRLPSPADHYEKLDFIGHKEETGAKVDDGNHENIQANTCFSEERVLGWENDEYIGADTKSMPISSDSVEQKRSGEATSKLHSFTVAQHSMPSRKLALVPDDFSIPNVESLLPKIWSKSPKCSAIEPIGGGDSFSLAQSLGIFQTVEENKKVTSAGPQVEEIDRQTRGDMKTADPQVEEIDRQTRGDMKTKADMISSPTPSTESNRPSFSRESSCSSEGNSRKLSSIAKNRAMFENNSSNANGSTGKWSGFKLAGASNSPSPANVKRTPSLSSTASTKSTPPNSAASSPKNSRANIAGSGNVDKFKAAFEAREANNNTIVEQQTSSPLKLPNDTNKPGAKKGVSRISPIRMTPEKDDTSAVPSFTSIFNVQTTVTNNKPTRLEIKSVTPSPYPGGHEGNTGDGKLQIDSTLRFEIDLSSTHAPITFNSSGSGVDCSPRKESTLPASSSNRSTVILSNASSGASPRSMDRVLPASSSPSTTRANAKSFLTSTLQRFTTEDSPAAAKTSANGSPSFTAGSEEEEQKRLDSLRQKLISLRKERQKVRDQKLSTVLPEDIDRLNSEYKRIDGEYKATHKRIEILEERKLQRIKDHNLDSIERRRKELEKNVVTGKKKLWEGSS